MPFPAERPHNADAGEILLRHRREHALVLVAVEKRRADFSIEEKRIRHDDRHRREGDQRKTAVHPGHEHDRKHEQDDDPQYLRELLGYEALERVEVGGAALDDVACSVTHMPRVGQAFDVGEQAVTGGLQEAFGRRRVGDAVAVLRRRPDEGDGQHRRRENPYVLTEPPEAAQTFDEGDRPHGQLGRRRAAEGVVDRDAHDLRAEHIAKRGQRRGQHTHKKERFAAPQEPPKQRVFRFSGRVRIHGFLTDFLIACTRL